MEAGDMDQGAINSHSEVQSVLRLLPDDLYPSLLWQLYSSTRTTPSQKAADTSFPFEKLPREIRDEIYFQILAPKSGKIRIRPKICWYCDIYLPIENDGCNHCDHDIIYREPPERGCNMHAAKAKGKVDVSILRVSRRVHSEAASILYSRNMLEFGCNGSAGADNRSIQVAQAIRRFSRNLSETYKPLVRHISLTMLPFNASIEGMRFPNLKTVDAWTICLVSLCQEYPEDWSHVEENILEFLAIPGLEYLKLTVCETRHEAKTYLLRREEDFDVMLQKLHEEGCTGCGIEGKPATNSLSDESDY